MKKEMNRNSIHKIKLPCILREVFYGKEDDYVREITGAL